MTRARGASRPRFRLLPTLLLTLAILGLPTVVYALGRSSSSFDISEVRVSGTHLVPAKKTLRLLQRAYVGDNLFTVTAADVRATLKPLSFVQAVTVDRDFPSTLAVGVTEYRPAAYALAGEPLVRARRERLRDLHRRRRRRPAPPRGEAGQAADGVSEPFRERRADGPVTHGRRHDLDRHGPRRPHDHDRRGRRHDRRAHRPPRRRPVRRRPARCLGSPSPDACARGARWAAPPTAAMLQVITALPNSYRRRLAAVEDDDGQITLRFAGGPVATWGDAQRTLAKTVALRTVLAEYEKAGKTCTQIDVSIPDRTLARPVLK